MFLYFSRRSVNEIRALAMVFRPIEFNLIIFHRTTNELSQQVALSHSPYETHESDIFSSLCQLFCMTNGAECGVKIPNSVQEVL